MRVEPGRATSRARVSVLAALLLLAVLCGVAVAGAPLAVAAPGHEPVPAATGSPATDPTPSATTPSPATTDPDASPVTVRLLSLSPEVTRPGDTLTVVAQVENTSTTDITSPVARLSVSKYRILTRLSLASWSDLPTTSPLGTLVESVPLPDTLPAGGSATVTFSVEADSLGLLGGQAGWAPRGLAVSVVGDGTTQRPGAPLGVLRTYLLWFPVADDEVTPLDVSVLVPVVGPATDPLDPATSASALEEATASSGRLGKVLASTEDVDAVGWAVDPALVGPVAGADEPASSASAGSWAGRLLTASRAREVFALPVFDEDWSAFAAAGVDLPERAPLPADLSGWRTDLTWPAQAAPSTQTLRLAAQAGAPVVVVAPGALEPSPELTYTPTGQAPLTTSAGPVTALVPDAVLSAQLATPTQSSAAAARQRMIAELSVISRERPAQSRQVLLTTPRTWSPAPDVARAQLSGIGSVPWARLAPVSTLIGAADPAVTRTEVASSVTVEEEISRATLDELAALTSRAESFAQIVPDPTVLTTPVTTAARAATSVAWRGDPEGRTAAVARVRDAVAELSGTIAVVPKSDFTLISSGSNLPVRLSNSLDQPATVTITLNPDDPRLVAEAPVTLVVPAQSEAEAMVKVTAVGRGNVTVTVNVTSPDGSAVASPYSFGVKVRADWENLGTGVIAVLLVLLLGAGIWRTIHRGRSDRRASAAAVELLEQQDQLDALDPAERDTLETVLDSPSPATDIGDTREQPRER